MKLSPSQMKTVRHQFDSLCKKVLRDESRDIDRQLARRAEKEICFSGLSDEELDQLYVMDDYPSDNTYFDVLHHQVAVKDERLAEAIASLPGEKRDIILLSYFLDMNDREIADALNMVKRTVQRRRTSSIKELKLRLEVKEDGQDAE